MRQRVSALILLFVSLVFVGVAHANTREENERNAQALYQKLEAGQVPTLGARYTAYSGPCWMTNSGVDPKSAVYLLAGLRSAPGGLEATWWITYGAQGRPNPYLDVTQESYNLRTHNPHKGHVFEGRKIVVPISTVPLLFGHFAEDRANPNIMYAAGTHMGYFYCQLEKLP